MRLIDADAFEADCRKRYCTGCENYNGIKCKSCWVADMLDEIENAPTLSPDDVRGVGEWEHQELAPTNWTFCSVCGRQRSKKYKWYYCPSCGTRMKGVSEDA
jgi:hypothetical protein